MERLLWALRGGEEMAARLVALDGEGWDELRREAGRQGLAGLLYDRLRRDGWGERIPASVWREWQRDYMRGAGYNTQRYGELAKLLRRLAAASIPVILLKGAHLAELVYGNIALRPMRDLDLLLPREAIESAEKMLAEMGYLPNADNPRQAREHFHLTYDHPELHVKIELHWQLELPGSPFAPPLAALWQRARPATVYGAPALTMSPPDLLVHLALHLSTHHLFSDFGLRSLVDVAEVLRYEREALSESALVECAQEWRAARPLYLVLRLTQELLGAQVPAETLSALQPEKLDARMLTWAKARLLTPPQAPEHDQANQLGELWAAPGWRDKAAHLWRAFLPNGARMTELYGARASGWRRFLYYPYRWGDLLARRAAEMWRLARGDRQIVDWADREAGRTALIRWLQE